MTQQPDATWYQDTVTAGPGGVMTDDVGIVTGDVTVQTTLEDDGRTARVTVQYTGAEEWYTMTGSPAPVPGGDLAAYHLDMLGRVRRGQAAQAS
ncbi:hypothetical protein ACIBCP_15915 [Streptomyces sp. NPDC051287]|uniref:hypothetical protein n=1 Tax=Streptomyces sp. NPDC051287 TaxID=3365648 RepID=UPI0037A0A802